MSKIQRVLSVTIAILMALTALPLNAFAADGIGTRIAELREVYDTGTYFTTNGQAYYSSEGVNCRLSNIPARGALPSGTEVARAIGDDSYSCRAFANYCFYYIYSQAYWNAKKVSTPSFGDYIKMNGERHSAIYLYEDSNYIYVYNGNGDSKNGVYYEQAFNKSRWYISEIYHATNYDEVKADGTPQTYSFSDGKYSVRNSATNEFLAMNSTDVLLSSDADSEVIKLFFKGGRSVLISPVSSSARSLSINSDGTTVGLSSQNANKWQFQSVSGGYIIHEADNYSKVLTIENGKIKLAAYTGNAKQIWTVSPYFTGSYTTLSPMYLRKTPGGEKLFDGTIPAGTKLSVTDVLGVWGKVQYNGYTGWMSLEYSAAGEAAASGTGFYETYETMRFRSQPSLEGSIIGTIPSGTVLTVTQRSGEWGKTSYNGTEGWMSLSYSRQIAPEDLTAFAVGSYKTNEVMNFRSSASLSGSIIAQIPKGMVLSVTQISGEWGKTVYNGKTGWISLNYSSFYDESQLENQDPNIQEELAVNWLVVDISKWQPSYKIDWNKLQEEGVKAVIIRIGGRGYGDTKQLYADDAFFDHYTAAKAAGLYVGAYFFSYALNQQQAIDEAKMTVDLLKKYNCKLDMPVYIDIEDYADGIYTDYQHSYAGKAVCSTVVNTFCSYIKAAGYYPGVYCNKTFAENLLEPSVFENRAVWIAHYGVEECGYKGENLGMWQYTRFGKLNGYSGGDIDLNRCYVNYPALIEDSEGFAPSSNDPDFVKVNEERVWKLSKEADCHSDGEQQLYQGSLLLASKIVPTKHSNTVDCVLKNNTVEIHAQDNIKDISASAFYDSSSPYYNSQCQAAKSQGGCIFSYCPHCGEILKATYYNKTNSCSHSYSEQTPIKASCTREGLKKTVCAICGITSQESITERSSHRDGAVSFVTENGETLACIKCADCSQVIYTDYKVGSGDIDGDGKISSIDARYTLRNAVDLTIFTNDEKYRADTDLNGTVNASDARSVLRYSVGLS